MSGTLLERLVGASLNSAVSRSLSLVEAAVTDRASGVMDWARTLVPWGAMILVLYVSGEISPVQVMAADNQSMARKNAAAVSELRTSTRVIQESMRAIQRDNERIQQRLDAIIRELGRSRQRDD